jgi:hypothetical protein
MEAAEFCDRANESPLRAVTPSIFKWPLCSLADMQSSPYR